MLWVKIIKIKMMNNSINMNKMMINKIMKFQIFTTMSQ